MGLSKKIDKSKIIYLNENELSQQFIKEQNRNEAWLSIEKLNQLGIVSIKITYWTPFLIKRPAFEWEKQQFLYNHSMLILFLTVFFSGLARNMLIERYRNKLQKQYEEFQQKRTEKIFESKLRLDEARQLAQLGKLAQALTLINRLLKSVSRRLPVYSEIIDLKKIILAQVEAGGGVITVDLLHGIHRKAPNSTDVSKLLYLRILGTPYAYQAPYGLETISIGRQRHKPDVPASVGNDVIIRVPGSEQKSLRISRKHLEIKRIDTEYFVIDQSGGRTRLNGKVLQENEPYRLRSMDRVLIADVLTLEVLIRVKLSGNKTDNVIRIDFPSEDQDNLLIEASIGDMVTEVYDE